MRNDIETSVWVACTGCGDEAQLALCRGCAKTKGPTSVREWLELEKYKPAASMSPETIAAFERCIEDMEAK